MVIEGVLYYIVIDEKWPKISYYHTDLQTLVGKISAQISINQSQ